MRVTITRIGASWPSTCSRKSTSLSPNWKARHKIHVNREQEQLLDAMAEGVDILKERRVDRMIRDKQEELKTADEMNVLITLQEIQRLNEVKKALARKTGRVVVG